MNRIERRHLVRTAAVGAIVTVLMILAYLLGTLQTLDHWLYDRRARLCQYYMPAPTTALVHLDIDDPTLAAMGAWPWPRSMLAEITREIHRLGAKVIAWDVIFPESQTPQYKPLGQIQPIEANHSQNNPRTFEGAFQQIDHDAQFAAAVRQCGNVLIGLSMESDMTQLASPIWSTMVSRLEENLLLGAQQIQETLADEALGNHGDPIVSGLFSMARREALYRRIERIEHAETLTRQQVRDEIWPGSLAGQATSAALVQLHQVHQVHQSMVSLRRFAIAPGQQKPPLLQTTAELPPIPALSRAAAGTGFVDYLPIDEGVVRSIPLWIEHRGWTFAQLGLALVCRHLDIDVRDVRLEQKRIILSTQEGARKIVIPVRSLRLPQSGRRVGMIFDIPWFGPTDGWKLMFDPPAYQHPKQHIPLLRIWQSVEARRILTQNNMAADQALFDLLDDRQPHQLAFEPSKAEAHRAKHPAPDDFQGRIEIIRWTLKEIRIWIDQFSDIPPDELTEQERDKLDRLLAAYEALETVLSTNQKLTQGRMHLADKLKGRSVLIGWAATGIAADFVPTPLHYNCPGAVIHGTIFNAVMTGEVWTRAPAWAHVLQIVVLGALLTVACTFRSPFRALVSCICLGAGYLAFNGIVLFDKYNLILDAAAPVIAVGLVWSTCTLYSFVAERAERARITRRFRSYVDPVLVDYVIEHPEQAKLDGQIRELTVVFTDLSGFTTLSERLREKTVPILNEFMELMVPVIRHHDGYVNKFLGDGIMFFYGAPQQSKYHARDATLTVLKMQLVLVDFNRQLNGRQLPTVKMRAGISSGNMVVGDAGSLDASDYTVLGDAVNVGARLESANKITGTSILMNDRTAMLLENAFLLRPIGRLQAVGKRHGVMTYEPLCPTEQGTADQIRLVEITNEMINAFILADFDECISVAQKLDEAFGPSKLTKLYVSVSELHRKEPPGADFMGQIALPEK